MDYGTIGSIFTVGVFVSFIGIVIWTFLGRNKAGFDEAANLVFDDEAKTNNTIQRKTTNTKQESAGNE
jgi:cytochrome c oxidase cbb3-type subunit 4